MPRAHAQLGRVPLERLGAVGALPPPLAHHAHLVHAAIVSGAMPSEWSHHRCSHSRQSRGKSVEPQCAAHCTRITRTELAARAMVRVRVRVSYPYPYPYPYP